MTPLSLTLKGFRGIRDGLGQDTITLDVERLTHGASLIAIVGGNGCGKTTIIDNLHPFPVMPSRAGSDGVGGFSYYDHLCLPESVKDLTWSHAGERYRSQLVFRVSGKQRRTEAFVHVQRGGRWIPVVLADGTIADGKVDTYVRCIAGILGSAETFFTSVFSAQGRRQLSAYRNAEVKVLLADLLGLAEIRELGARASETAKLLKAELEATRRERAGIQGEGDQVSAELRALGDATARVSACQHEREAQQAALDGAKGVLATSMALREVALQREPRRKELASERGAIIEARTTALDALDAQQQRERERLERLGRALTQRRQAMEGKRGALMTQRKKLEAVVGAGARIERGGRRLDLAQRALAARETKLGEARARVARLQELAASERRAADQIAGIEREAGQASMRVQDLTRRLGLSAEVPCAGTDLQGRCQLLGDARTAQSLKPSADAQVAQLAEARASVTKALQEMRAETRGAGAAPEQLAVAERRLTRSRERCSRFAMLAAQQGQLAQARETLGAINEELAASARGGEESSEESEERALIGATLTRLSEQRVAEAKRHREALDRIDGAIAAFPPPFDASLIEREQAAVALAQRALAAAETAYLKAVGDAHSLEVLRQRQAALGGRRSAVDLTLNRIEQGLGTWALFAKCMSNDGLIALSIDDAGPALAGLANALLLACYGPRFTVSIKTLVETSKGETREGFDIVVHDADSGDSKSVTLMSGGERVWINECLTRAIALYLAQNSGRQYETLFSDEADGPLDPERKRMFLAMKREVLRLGGYRREFFVSQSPELTAMADGVIDLAALFCRAEGATEPA